MSTISNVGKVAYVYDQPNDTWHPVAGYTNTTEAFAWSGAHNFSNTVNFNSVLNAKAGINNFLDAAARDLAITSPTNGIVVFVRQTNAGAVINQIQYYFNGAWRVYGENANLVTKTSNHTLELADAGRTLDIDVATTNTITIPTNAAVPFLIGTQIAFIQTGAGQTVFSPSDAVTVIILSKNSNRKISSRYSPATLIKKDTNTWVLVGDLTA
jgi:hypothetical protein